jgi:hypothetical protein
MSNKQKLILKDLKGVNALLMLLSVQVATVKDENVRTYLIGLVEYLTHNLLKFEQTIQEDGQVRIDFTTTDKDQQGNNSREIILKMFEEEISLILAMRQLIGQGEEFMDELLKAQKDFDKDLKLKELELEKRKKDLEKREKALAKKEKAKENTQIALHTVSQFFGDNKQLNMFSDNRIEAFSRATGLSLTNRPTNYGVVLNQAQERVFFGILKAFSDTNYKGDELKKTGNALGDVYSLTQTSKETLVINDNAPYKNIDAIPVVKLTQAEIIKLSGYGRTYSEKTDVTNAISFLGTNQFCFYWLRAKMDQKGKIVKDKNGEYLKEEVMEVGTLFRIKYVKEEGTDKIEYYEISPSAPLIDQVKKHFLLVPNNWREQVKEITGNRASSYTYNLLLWLRKEYEQIRKYNKYGGKNRKPKPFKISISWEDMATALKMPESMYKRNRVPTMKIIKKAYSVAIELGYLVKVEDNGATDILYLNESYYPKPGELV